MSEREKPSARRMVPFPSILLSRRALLKGGGAAAAVSSLTGAGTVLGAATAAAQQATPVAGVPGAGTEQRAVQFFDPHEAQTVDALVSRIIPGTAADPGAHEANVVFYIDQMLGGANLGYELKTYKQGPFLVTSDEPVTVESSSNRDLYDYVLVASEQVSRYGYQSMLQPQEIYRRGLSFVDAYAQSQFQKDLIDLTTDQQDSVLTDMEADKATGFDGPSAKGFFTQLRNDTIEGMFADPMYGGNLDMAGWKLLGYPGAQRNYTPDDIKNPNFHRDPQTLAQLMAKEGS